VRRTPGHRLVPAGIPPTVPAVPTALEARARGGGHAAARRSVHARAVIASYTRRIADPPRLKFLSRVEYATQRILEPLGYVSPAEFEEQFHRIQAAPAERLTLN